ncbi:hypothetical protein SAMN05660748_3428 [Blastococcus aggregatus]|uniref:Uncharacterized protein n=1 Tax=Blastococcus aggregatus TaxID=38502 RepID=A0A285V9B7_9ACTN|nr:hypothetical protein [Blastococcus aggregatus]SOC50669.1 hypothetical protein SAMN05660748_3428 [Blastococcus aggregatus]
MDSGLILIVFGGFLLGGAWSVFRADSETEGRTTPQVVLAVALLVAALMATASGILRLV